MHDHGPVLDGRVHRHLTEKIWPASTTTLAELDVAFAPVTDAPDASGHAAAPGAVGQGEPISIDEALRLTYEPAAVGDEWGPAWGTTWMRFRGQVPSDYLGAHVEAAVDLGAIGGPGFTCEGLVVRPDGTVVKGLNPRNQWVPIECDDDGRFEFYVEAAANPVMLESPPFRETERGTKAGAGPAPIHTLRTAELQLIHDEVRALALDIEALHETAAQLPEDSGRRWEIRRALDRALDALSLRDIVGTAAAARSELRPTLERTAEDGSHLLHAVGHAHIDSAWLWPLRETRRKVARTIANQLTLTERFPEHRFSFPAAQHSAWLEEDHPQLFERLQQAVAEGRIIPVGGMWVESDANLPSGEAMCRQFLQGQQFFTERFGKPCTEVWLPDSFGYSGGLPQLAKLAGARWFLTQKISWNQVNDFPHHSFTWEGIDGTRIFTHFPPADTYCSDLSAENLHHAARNFRDKGRSATSLVPFGYGDGGGGPTREMLERVERVGDLAGHPRVEVSTPTRFFEQAEREHEGPSVWVGELYLELHRGTFTSVARVKRGNRRCEELLREAELWTTTAEVRGVGSYPAERLGEIWREVLLYQFHDILPGTCIAWVYDEVLARQEALEAELTQIIDDAQHALAAASGEASGEVVFNGAPVVRDGVPAFGACEQRPADGDVEVHAEGDGFVVDGASLRVTVDGRGGVTSLFDKDRSREVLPAGTRGSLLQLHPDFPNAWDAWDIDLASLNTCETLDASEVVAIERGVEVRYAFHDSTATQRLTLAPGDGRLHVEVDVDWHERDSLLKLVWPVDVHSDEARCEIQMGHITRPTHTNTSWDAQRFEVHAHRWVHVGEPGYGVAIANERTYGWDFQREARADGGTYTSVRASLLKGPRYPDPRADIGEHTFRFTLRPGGDVADAVADGYLANHTPRVAAGGEVAPLITADGGVAVEAVKLAEDGSGDVVVRLYEPYGKRTDATLTTSFAATDIVETDLLEAPLGTSDQQQVAPSVVQRVEGSQATLALRPFQVATLRISRA